MEPEEERGDKFKDVGENPSTWSIKQPLTRKQRVDNKKAKRILFNRSSCSSFSIQKRRRWRRYFNVAFRLKEMQNKRNKEHPKLKIQKIFFQAQFQFEESSRDVPLPYINRNILYNTNPITFSP